ncbi:MAG: hypothetical protein QM817_19915 [Archangium sp.]
MAAWLGSRALVSTEAPSNGGPAVVAPSPVVGSGPVLQRIEPLPTAAAPKERPETRAMIDSARSGQLQPVAGSQPKQLAVADDKPDEQPNPFVGVSAELDYADRLRFEIDGGTERLTSARDVYQRCLDAVPEMQRCKEGLAAVEAKLNPPKAVERPTPLPNVNKSAADPANPIPRAKP